MLITCEYCGAVFDTEKSPICPNCRASAGTNDNYERHVQEHNQHLSDREKYKTEQERYSADYERFQAEQEYLRTEELRHSIRRDKRQRRFSTLVKTLFVLPAVIALIVGVFLFVNFPNVVERRNDAASLPEQRIGINEEAKTQHFTFVCDEIKKVDPSPNKIDKGTALYEFHLIIQNHTDETKYFSESIICTADGFKCDQVNYKPHAVEKILQKTDLESKVKMQASICFVVPDDAKDVSLKIGENVYIVLKEPDKQSSK